MNLPTSVKHGADGAAFTAAFAHFWGVWSGHVASIASTAAFVWLLVQAFFFFKDRYFKKK